MSKSDIPDPAAALYQGPSGAKYHDIKRALRPQALPWVMALRAEKFQKHVRDDDVVFEFGVGAGWNLGRLRCSRRIGCDVADRTSERIATLKIEFLHSLAHVDAGTIDIVICHHALEHLLHPAQTLMELKKILKPQGKVILHVPWERERKYARFDAKDPNHHLYTWNAQDLGNLISVLGYQVISIRVRRYGYDRLAANLALQLRVGETGFRLMRLFMISLRPLREVELIASPGSASILR
jgi:SAM-dependent methyltransferase